jgi:tRNA-2-methylthio-N6-dimethylallyladenosine synthase
VSQGFREVVFLGQTVNSYHDGEHDFADLLREASRVEGLLRIRFTSPHPSDMSERVIEAIAEGGPVCPQVHLPLQSGSDAVLRAMNRTYTWAEYRGLVDRLRAAIPDLALSTDIIAGFTGETEDDFAQTVQALEEVRYDSAFLFKYSMRPDTKAFRWRETVSEQEKGRRLTRLIDLQQSISAQKNDAWIGREVEVLVEGRARRNPGQLFGKSLQFKTVVWSDDGAEPGTLRRLRVLGATSNTLLAGVQARRAEPELLGIT